MQKNVQCLLLKNDLLLISEVVEVTSDIGQPDCKLVKPFTMDQSTLDIKAWLDFTPQDVIMLRSDDVLTFVEPSKDLLDKYLKIT
jgi:hypothetical protein